MAELWRIVWGGTVYDSFTGGNQVEEWSCSLSMLSLATFTVPSTTDSVRDIVVSYHTGAGTAINKTVALEWVKLNQFDINTGLQVTDPTNVRYVTTGNRGGNSSAAALPLQVANRISLDNGTRSRRARGGWYLPRPGLVVGLDGYWTSAGLTGVTLATKTMIDGLNALPGPNWEAGIWSRAGGSFTPSTRIRVGYVPDTQRRRRSELVEQWDTQPIA